MAKIVSLKNKQTAEISLLSPKVTARQLMEFINKIIHERAFIVYRKKITLNAEKEWRLQKLKDQKTNQGFLLVVTVDGQIAGTSEARRDRTDSTMQNIGLGIAIAKKYRGIGLGEALLRENIAECRRFFSPKPKTIYLTVFKDNKVAQRLYRKIGFRKFAVFPNWVNHYGKFGDEIFMKLKK